MPGNHALPTVGLAQGSTGTRVLRRGRVQAGKELERAGDRDGDGVESPHETTPKVHTHPCPRSAFGEKLPSTTKSWGRFKERQEESSVPVAERGTGNMGGGGRR